MGETIGQVLSFGIAVTLNPVTIIAVVLVLDSPRAKTSGPLLLVGWMLGLFAAAALVAVLSTGAGAGDGGEPSTAVTIALPFVAAPAGRETLAAARRHNRLDVPAVAESA